VSRRWRISRDGIDAHDPDEQRDTHEVYEISVKAFEDGIELLHLIEVMQAQNNDAINEKLSAAGAAGAAMVVRNGLLSRIILFLAGAYAAPTRPGDLHLRRAFDLLQQPAVRDELGLRGSPTLLDDATRLWARCKGDHRLLPIKHFRDKFTAGGFKFERKHHLTTLERMVRWQEIAYD
jgi:hypothetical protein